MLCIFRQHGTDGIHDGAPDVNGDNEVLCLERGEVEAVFQDDGEEGAEAVEDGDDADLDAAVEPGLDVLGGHFDVVPFVVACAAGVFFHCGGAVPHYDAVLFGEEVGGFEVLGNQEAAAAGPDEGDDAFDYVKPDGLLGKVGD